MEEVGGAGGATAFVVRRPTSSREGRKEGVDWRAHDVPFGPFILDTALIN